VFFLNASKQARVLPEAAAARSGSVTCGRQEGTENAETLSGRLAAAAKANLTASTAASENGARGIDQWQTEGEGADKDNTCQ
jgi:hypothetical protein